MVNNGLSTVTWISYSINVLFSIPTMSQFHLFYILFTDPLGLGHVCLDKKEQHRVWTGVLMGVLSERKRHLAATTQLCGGHTSAATLTQNFLPNSIHIITK